MTKKCVIACVKGYQKFISPLHKGKCRFTPTCSSYFIEAVEKFGVIKGIKLGLKRILRCNHFSKGGLDAVPENIVGDYKWLL